jgi:hypothetical protein
MNNVNLLIRTKVRQARNFWRSQDKITRIEVVLFTAGVLAYILYGALIQREVTDFAKLRLMFILYLCIIFVTAVPISYRHLFLSKDRELLAILPIHDRSLFLFRFSEQLLYVSPILVLGVFVLLPIGFKLSLATGLIMLPSIFLGFVAISYIGFIFARAIGVFIKIKRSRAAYYNSLPLWRLSTQILPSNIAALFIKDVIQSYRKNRIRGIFLTILTGVVALFIGRIYRSVHSDLLIFLACFITSYVLANYAFTLLQEDAPVSWLLKTSTLSLRQIWWSKFAFMALGLNLISIIMLVLMAAVGQIGLNNFLSLWVTMIAINIFLAGWSLIFGFSLFPSVDWGTRLYNLVNISVIVLIGSLPILIVFLPVIFVLMVRRAIANSRYEFQ